jgi:hypothetical protein
VQYTSEQLAHDFDDDFDEFSDQMNVKYDDEN